MLLLHNLEVAQNRVDFEENQDNSDVRNEKNEEAPHNSQLLKLTKS